VEEAMHNLVPIGRFSRVCQLTVKALRHYDELGLLRPALVDEQSGYRYYSLSQAADAERIRLLRALDLPLDEVRAILAERDPGVVRARLVAHAGRLEARIAGYRDALALLHHLLDHKEETMTREIRTTELAPQPILSIRQKIALADIGSFVGGGITELCAYLGSLGVRPVGPPLSLYHDEELKEHDAEVEVAVPCERRVAGAGRMTGRVLEGGPAAVTLHVGAYGTISQTYCALAQWIAAQGRVPAPPSRETYLVSFAQTPDPAEWRTEVAWPMR
jgi:DNA-binding transcriptional MerR regulator